MDLLDIGAPHRRRDPLVQLAVLAADEGAGLAALYA
jgi:hypothetical protein